MIASRLFFVFTLYISLQNEGLFLWKYEDIGMDGNCLFCLLFKMVSGSQEYCSKILGQVYIFIAKDRRGYWSGIFMPWVKRY